MLKAWQCELPVWRCSFSKSVIRKFSSQCGGKLVKWSDICRFPRIEWVSCGLSGPGEKFHSQKKKLEKWVGREDQTTPLLRGGEGGKVSYSSTSGWSSSSRRPSCRRHIRKVRHKKSLRKSRYFLNVNSQAFISPRSLWGTLFFIFVWLLWEHFFLRRRHLEKCDIHIGRERTSFSGPQNVANKCLKFLVRYGSAKNRTCPRLFHVFWTI